MPNWCNNGITITGPKDKIQALYQEIKGKDKFLDVMVPMPTALRDTTSPPYPKDSPHYKPQPYVDGYNNWYDWCVNNWGTKWDINDDGLVFEDTEDGYATISGWFESAWAPPIEAYNTYMENNEEIQILATYEEGGMDFAGIYDNGDDDYMEGLSVVCERIVRGTETLEEQTELFQRLDEEFDLVENRREYIEDEMEEERRDEKNGVYPQHEDVAN